MAGIFQENRSPSGAGSTCGAQVAKDTSPRRPPSPPEALSPLATSQSIVPKAEDGSGPWG